MSVDARSVTCRNSMFADVQWTTFTCELLLPAKQSSWQFRKLHVITVVEIKQMITQKQKGRNVILDSQMTKLLNTRREYDYLLSNSGFYNAGPSGRAV
jgi:flagellar basal body rod protein FlgB